MNDGYKLQVKHNKNFVTEAVFDTLRSATTHALYCARNHKHIYRVKFGRDVIFTAHPDGSWTGKQDHEPEAPI